MMQNQTRAGRKGFTLIELLIAMGIIGIMTSVALVAINPAKQLTDAQNAERKVIVNQLEKAAMQYILSTTQEPVANIPVGAANAVAICRSGVTSVQCLNIDTLVPDFVVALPLDPPQETVAQFTGYGIYKDTSSRIHICSTHLPESDSQHCTIISIVEVPGPIEGGENPTIPAGEEGGGEYSAP